MKLGSVTVLTLTLAFAGTPISFTLWAQDVSVVPGSDTERCVHWMKTSVPGITLLDPVDFCSGVKREGSPDGWGSVWKCGQPADAGAAPRYCTSSGQFFRGEAWAAGVSSATRDGREFFEGNSDAAKDLAAATFYTRTTLWMENLRVPPGMYKLVPSRAPDGWRLSVSRQNGEATPQSLGTVKMKGSVPDSLGMSNLVTPTVPWAEGCPGPSPNFDLRELHFKYGSADLFVCIRPEQVVRSQEADLTER
jgi:hypothetical protein